VDSVVTESDAANEFLDPLVTRARARVGSVLRDKWHLDVLLGVGGMASVYAATHRNGSRAAVKLLHTELSINPDIRDRFLREGYLANAVGHEGAVRVIDDDTAEDGSLFLVTELLDGETLEARRMRFDGHLDEDEVLSVVDQLLDVLVAAHDKGVIHRDLKPENVFLTRSGQVKVLDFGIARLRELSKRPDTATRAGESMGTPAYMAPEQARGLWDDVDGRSDLWAVGATMFCLLAGRLVHQGRTTNEQLLSAMTHPAPPLRSVAIGVSALVANVVDRALAFNKAMRWPDARRMQESVRHAYHDRTGASIATAPRLTVPESVENRTLPSHDALSRGLPTTVRPVARGSSRFLGDKRVSVRALAGLGVVVSAAAIAIVVSSVGRTRAGAGDAAKSGTVEEAPLVPAGSVPVAPPLPSASAAPPVAAVAALSAAVEPGAPDASVGVETLPPLPEVAATDLPSAVPPPAQPAPSAATKGANGGAASKASCSPPYVINPATGKKNWKVECL
jgi:serine/threonine-protein kinase